MQQQGVHTFKNKGASLTIDLSKGGKVLELILRKKGPQEGEIKVISTADSPKENKIADEFLGSGSYLMYPWVNRLSKDSFTFDGRDYTIEPVYRDNNGYSLHGFYASTPRKVIQQGSDFVKFEPEQQDPRFPQLTETLRLLSGTQFQITVDLRNVSDVDQIFGLGYHPFISLNGQVIDDLELHTNMDQFIELNEHLIPEKQLKYNGHDILHKIRIGEYEFDNGLCASLHYEKYWVSLFDVKEQYGVHLYSDSTSKKCYDAQKVSQIPMKFWQFYTPPDRKSIAIEPLTCSVDAFLVKNSGVSILKPGESKRVSFIMESISEL